MPRDLRAAARAYCRRELAANTRRRVEGAVRAPSGPFAPIAELAIAELTAPVLARRFAALGKTHGRETRVTLWRTLVAIVRHVRGAKPLPWGDWRPKLGSRPGAKARRRVWCRTPAEVRRLIAAAEALDQAAGYAGRARGIAAKIALCVRLGLRQGEIAGLRWGNLHEGDRLLGVILDWERLRRAPTVLDVPDDVRRLLQEWRSRSWAGETPHPEAPIFPGPLGDPWTRGEVVSIAIVRQAARAAGLNAASDFTVQGLRDTFVTFQAQRSKRGVSLVELAAITRHGSGKSVQRYVRRLHAFERARAGRIAVDKK